MHKEPGLIDYDRANRHARYYCSHYGLPESEFDDILQEVAIALWKGINPFGPAVDYIRSKSLLSKIAYKKGCRIYSKNSDDRYYTPDYTDYVYLSRLTREDVELTALRELSSWHKQSALYGGISEARLSQKKKEIRINLLKQS